MQVNSSTGLPNVPIIFLTSTRTEYAVRTIESVLENLHYDGRLIWHVTADNSNRSHLLHVKLALNAHYIESLTIQESQATYGIAANAAWDHCAQNQYPVTFWLEDDWVLTRQLDITPQVVLLMENDSVGCVRYSYLNDNLVCDTVGYASRMYLNIRRTRPYAFSGNPHLKHTRFNHYGRYPEDKNPGDTEIFYDGQIREKEDGPGIWWVLGIGDDPPFAHIGEERSY